MRTWVCVVTVLAAATLAASTASSGPVAAMSRKGGDVLPRATADRSDDFVGPQVHVMYLVPSDGVDRHLDTNGAIQGWVDSMQSWLRQQTGGRTFRFDTYQGGLDITFFRLQATAAEVEARDFAGQEIETELSGAGYGIAGYTNAGQPPPVNVRDKIYAVFYDGGSKTYCGNGGTSFAYTYLFECAGLQPLIMLHEIIHSLGFVPTCAPHSLPPDHADDPSDLMYPTIGSTARLDPGHDDYYDAFIPGCHDLASSRLFTDGGAELNLTTTPAGLGTVYAVASGNNYESSFPALPGSPLKNPNALACPQTCTAYADTWPVQTVTLEENPAVGGDFAGWTGACSGHLYECQLTLDQATTVGAIFRHTTPPGPLRLTVFIAGSGRVTSSPSGIACPRNCQASYPAGTRVILRPKPTVGWRFQGWKGACRTTRPTCSLLLYQQSGNQHTQATFKQSRSGAPESPTYTGHARAADLTLAVVARKPGATAWALSIKFTSAGTPLYRKVERLIKLNRGPSVFCIAGPGITGLLWDAGFDASDIGKNSISVPRFVNPPTPKSWLCGLTDDSGMKSRRAFVSRALLAVTLKRQ